MRTSFENWLRPYELVEYLQPDGKLMASADPTTVVGSDRPMITEAFAAKLVDMASVYHRWRVLIPYAGRSLFLRALRKYTRIEYWMVEPNPTLFNELLDNDELAPGENGRYLFDPATIWGIPFQDWVDEFDPEGSQVGAILLAGPLNDAAADLIAAWDYLKPRGGVVALLPFNDLFGKTDAAEYMRNWCCDRGLYYGIPVPRLSLQSSEKNRLVLIFGEKEA